MGQTVQQSLPEEVHELHDEIPSCKETQTSTSVIILCLTAQLSLSDLDNEKWDKELSQKVWD